MKKRTYKVLVFEPCEECGNEDAMWCFWCRKWLCDKCALKSFKAWIAKVTGGAGIIIGLIWLLAA